MDERTIKIKIKMDKAKLDETTFHFSQEGNCMKKADEYEYLEIKCLADLGIDNSEGKCFYELKTEGWSIDSLDELQELFDRIQKSLSPEKNIKKQPKKI
jgi:hypothetical protein